MRSQRLTKSEMTVMSILWKAGRHLTVYEVLEHFDEPKPTYTTVSTVISRMMHKGIVAYNKGKGKTYYYYPILSKAAYYKLNSSSEYVRKLVLIIICVMCSFIVAAICVKHMTSYISREKSIKQDNNDIVSSSSAEADKQLASEEHGAIDENIQNDRESEPLIIEENVDQLPEYTCGIEAIQDVIVPYMVNGHVGRCYAKCLIDEEGNMVDVSFVGYDIPDIDKAELLRNVGSWIPARKDGRSVATYITIPLFYKDEYE